MPLQNDNFGKLLLRLLVGGLILFHGLNKAMHPEAVAGIVKNVEAMGLPGIVAYLVYIGEVVAPLMLILGWFARIAGLIVVVNMVFAVMLVHTTQIFTLSKSGGWALELQAFYFFGGLIIFFLGSGRMALRPD